MGKVAWQRSMCESSFYAVFIEVTLVQYVVHLSDIPTCDIGGDIPTESSCLPLFHFPSLRTHKQLVQIFVYVSMIFESYKIVGVFRLV